MMVDWERNSRRGLVLLTAAITPNAAGRVVLRDPELRREQYKSAVVSWANLMRGSEFGLAVVETTGAMRSDILGARGTEEIEFVPYTPSQDECDRGKGAIEMGAIRHAINIAGPFPSDFPIYKCTGRLVIKNAAKIITPLPIRSIRARMTVDRSWMDTRLVGASVEVWEKVLFPMFGKIDDREGVYCERVLAAAASSNAALRQCTLERFPMRPAVEGASGSTGETYRSRNSSIRHWVMNGVEKILWDYAKVKQV